MTSCAMQYKYKTNDNTSALASVCVCSQSFMYRNEAPSSRMCRSALVSAVARTPK